ncbi:MAG: Mrp/NBP35 family ATP-binding protein [Oscillospiraceae bacterium]|nr:Mrp/NBP35 family ATP-binding protein [Oscillospiraceae bacterium]
MNECTHDCSSCGSDCPSKQSPESLLAPMNQYSNVKNVIAVVSGKGGVGKSLVTSLMACRMQHRTKKTAVLDADITGPSIPKIFGIEEQQAMGDDHGLLPLSTKNGLKIMSINSLLPDKTSPVLWRGPVISGVVKQFWTEVCWGDVDEIAAAHGIDNVAKLPMDPAIAAACDSGDIGSIRADCLAEFAEKLAAACGA